MLYEILNPIKDYIVADSFKEAVKQYIKKHEIKIRNIDLIEITDQTKTEIFTTEYSSKNNNFKITSLSSALRILPDVNINGNDFYGVLPPSMGPIPIQPSYIPSAPASVPPVLPPPSAPPPRPPPPPP